MTGNIHKGKEVEAIEIFGLVPFGYQIVYSRLYICELTKSSNQPQKVDDFMTISQEAAVNKWKAKVWGQIYPTLKPIPPE